MTKKYTVDARVAPQFEIDTIRFIANRYCTIASGLRAADGEFFGIPRAISW